MDLKPTCPEDSSHTTRVEYSHELGRTLFCTNCMKHHKLCNSTRYMDPCDLPLNHPGYHFSERTKTSWS